METDLLRYETDPNFETYALKALSEVGGTPFLELDSESNPSLE